MLPHSRTLLHKKPSYTSACCAVGSACWENQTVDCQADMFGIKQTVCYSVEIPLSAEVPKLRKACKYWNLNGQHYEKCKYKVEPFGPHVTFKIIVWNQPKICGLQIL